jgi:hypothetical protein
MSFGFKAVNQNGETVIDADFLNYALAYSGSVTCGNQNTVTVTYPTALTTTDVPLIALKRWVGIDFMFQDISSVGTPGNWTGFRIRCFRASASAPTSVTLQYKVFATGLPRLEDWGLQVFDGAGKRVFDSSRKLLIFRGRVEGETSAWQHTSGQVYQGGRTDYFTHRYAVIGADEYVLVSAFPPCWFGRVNVYDVRYGSATLTAIVQPGFGFYTDGSFRLIAYTDLGTSNYPGPSQAVFFDLPTAPILAN